MASNSKRFQVGDISCVAISDGTFSYPPDWFFSNVAGPELKRNLQDHGLPTDHVTSPYTCLVLRTGERKVLIDTGANGLLPATGDLLTMLSAEGLSAEDITDVVLTHAHPDHIGGLLDAQGKPTFRNARHFMSKTEWDFWTLNPDLNSCALDSHIKEMLINCAQKYLPPLKPAMELFDGEKELLPGLWALPAPGHTPGHIALAIASASEQLLQMADAVLHPLHLEHRAWRTIFDLNHEDAAATRQRLLDRAATDKAAVVAYHFPFPSLGHVVNRGTAWKWEPANS
jgi:glyoxylase-like metal-dependent hydrolase (beta-lactamase superfamily II)